MANDDHLQAAPADEIVRLLDLSAAQLEAGIGEAERPVQQLAEAFFALSAIAAEAIAALSAAGPAGGAASVDLPVRWAGVQQQMQGAVEAFQFHDRLCQRIGHVRDGLSQIAGLVNDREAAARDTSWQGLHGALRGRYTIDHERVMFDLLVEGRADTALRPPADTAGSVELF